jgi:predicted DsbA family dithiol-disulfide isomerase
LRVPFFLEPNYSCDEGFSETNRVRLHRKWGGERAFEEQKQRHTLKDRGRQVGIAAFDLDRLASSTMASHRLVQWITKTRGFVAAERAYASLNRRHFEQGARLNDRAMLAEVAEEVGVAVDEAVTFLQSSEGLGEIEEVQALLRELGVNSIPTFVIGGRTAVGGAAHTEELTAAFRQVEASATSHNRSIFGEVRVP